MSINEWMDPAVWVAAGLAATCLLGGLTPRLRGLRVVGGLLLLLAAAGLLASLAAPQLLPVKSAIVNADGTTGDPRVLSALLVGAGAFVALLPAWAALGGTPIAALGVALPGLLLGALLAAVAYAGRLRQPPALAGVGLAGLVLGLGISLAFRATARQRAGALVLQASGTALLAGVAMLSLHGVRSGSLAMVPGAMADTVGTRVEMVRVDVPRPDTHVFRVVLHGARDSVVLQPRLVGASGKTVRSEPAAHLFSGPILVPIALDEQRQKAHDIVWLGKADSVRSGGATIRFSGFRVAPGDSVGQYRMFVDLAVTTAAGTQTVSPGVVASHRGEIPFAALAAGYGPIVAARFDVDRKRVGLVLPQMSDQNVTRVAVFEVRQRPALGIAWLAGALALVGALLGLAGARTSKR